MATLTAQTLLGARDDAGVELTYTAADQATGGDQALFTTGRLLILARNVAVSAPHNVTVTSAAEPAFGRTGDITAQVDAGTTKAFGPFTQAGWANASNALVFEGDSAEIEFAVVAVP